jgi:hypothetical protein
LISRFKNLACRKSYFYGEKDVDMVALHRLNSIEKVMIGGSGHFMLTRTSVSDAVSVFRNARPMP